MGVPFWASYIRRIMAFWGLFWDLSLLGPLFTETTKSGMGSGFEGLGHRGLRNQGLGFLMQARGNPMSSQF